MKILVLMHEDLIPPDRAVSKDELDRSAWKTEYDVTHHLKKMGHDVLNLGIGDELAPLRQALIDFEPHLVFNLLEEFRGEAVFDYHLVAYLELMNVKYTGCNPRGLLLARDKALGKKVLKYHRISTPEFIVFKKGKPIRTPSKIKYPLFVKTLNEEASLGIAQDSVVTNAETLKERVEFLFGEYGTDVIAETYIDGREFYVSILGNERLQVFPIVELEFGSLSEKAHPIATRKVKWDLAYRKKYNIQITPPKDLSKDLKKQMISLCRRAYRSLDLSGYARMDIRVTSNNEIYLIEANPNPDIGYGDEFHSAAELHRWNYSQVLKKILNLGIAYNRD